MVGLIFFRRLLFGIALLAMAARAQAEGEIPEVFDASGRVAHLSRETLREIFFMRLTAWPDGSPIHVFVLPDDNPVHIQFAKMVLGVYPFQLRSAWDRLIFSGTGFAPTTVQDMDEMREKVETTPGGIGYAIH